MLRGQRWQVAEAQADLQISQATVYRLLSHFRTVRRFLVEVAQHYTQSAPDVSDWAGELYERCADDWRTISLDELRTAEWLRDGDT